MVVLRAGGAIAVLFAAVDFAAAIQQSWAPARCPATSRLPPRLAASPMLKLNKQQELARLLERARLQKQGLAPDLAAEAPKPKPTPKKRAAPKVQSREELFSQLNQMKQAAGGDQLAATKGHQRYGVASKRSAPQRPAAAQPQAATRPPTSSAKAAEAALAKEYSYDDFSELLKSKGKSARTVRALSAERLARGSLFPVPAELRRLDGVPNSFESLEALAQGRRTLVILSSMETFLSDRLRQTLVAFAGTMPASKLDASILAVSRVPTSALRKLARKANVGFTLLSDPESAWISKLKATAAGEVTVYVVDAATGKVVSSHVEATPQTLVATITDVLERRAEEPAGVEGDGAGDEGDEDEEDEKKAADSFFAQYDDYAAAADEMPEEWQFAAAPGFPQASAPRVAPQQPPAVSQPASSSSTGVSALEAENERLKAALAAAQRAEEERKEAARIERTGAGGSHRCAPAHALPRLTPPPLAVGRAPLSTTALPAALPTPPCPPLSRHRSPDTALPTPLRTATAPHSSADRWSVPTVRARR